MYINISNENIGIHKSKVLLVTIHAVRAPPPPQLIGPIYTTSSSISAARRPAAPIMARHDSGTRAPDAYARVAARRLGAPIGERDKEVYE
eukprot:COSAG02_NODE_1666_length_11424_cov_5.733245_2_plen_90_part_00